MANIEDANVYIHIDDFDNLKIKNMFEKFNKSVIVSEYKHGYSYSFPVPIYMMMFYLDEDERRHIHEESLYYASDVNVRFILDSYTDNETSFEFLTELLENTQGDFLFISDGEMIFERRNNIVFANKRDENFPMCSFNDCYELLKTEHINGYYYRLHVCGKSNKDVDEIKQISYDICKKTICSDDIKIIEYSDIEYAFSMSTKYFDFNMKYYPDKEQENLSEREYVICVNIPFSEEFKDNRKTYAKLFIKNIAEHFEITKSNIFPGYKVSYDKTFEEYIDIAFEK